MHKQILKAGCIAAEYVKVNARPDAVYFTCSIVLPEEPSLANAGFFLYKIMGHP
jgi:hypothetical protein